MSYLRNRIATLANMWAREGRKAEAEVLRGILDQDRTSADDHRAFAIERLATVTAMSRDQATDVVDAIVAAAVRTQEDLEGAEDAVSWAQLCELLSRPPRSIQALREAFRARAAKEPPR